MKINKFLLYNFVFVVIFLLNTAIALAGGDIGGGGVAKVVKLTPTEKAKLQQQPDVDSAFAQWLQTIDDKKEMDILKNIFEQHVIPQIK